MLLVFGIIEFGRLFWTREALQEAAIAGARCAGILQTACATGGSFDSGKTTSYVQQVAGGWGLTVPGSGITPTNSAACGGVSSGFSQVTITYRFRTAVPRLLVALAGGDNLTLTACFPNQQTGS
jgi:Flp pilus assembly protein TadG